MDLHQRKSKFPVSYLQTVIDTSTVPCTLLSAQKPRKGSHNFIFRFDHSTFENPLQIAAPESIRMISEVIQENPSAILLPFYKEVVRPATIAKLKMLFPEVPMFFNTFVFDEYQIWETRSLKADTFMVNSDDLDYHQLQFLCEVGRDLKIEPIVHISTKASLYKAFETDIKILLISCHEKNQGWLNKDLQNQISETAKIDARKVIWDDSLLFHGIIQLSKACIDTVLISSTNRLTSHLA